MSNTYFGRLITLRMVKTYTNGVTHAMYSCDTLAASRRAEIDAEDTAAGLVGTWNITVKTVR